MKRIIILTLATVFALAAVIFYCTQRDAVPAIFYHLIQKDVVEIENVQTIHVLQECLNAEDYGAGVEVKDYFDVEDESVKAFLESLNEADKKFIWAKYVINTVMKEYTDCEYFREIIIEMKDGTSTYVYYGYTDNEPEKLSAYSFCKTGTCYKYSDDNLIKTMDNMIESYKAASAN